MTEDFVRHSEESTDKGILEEEIVYSRYLKEGKPVKIARRCKF